MTEARRLALSGRQQKRRSLTRPTARAGRVLFARLVLAVFALFLHATRISEAWLVQHALCEHGEVVHAAHAPEAGAEDAPQGADERSQAADERSQGADDPAHDHCFASALHHRTGDIGPSVAEPSLIAIALSPGVASQPETRPIDLLSLAPKGSPPARGGSFRIFRI
jgi:hypothetical protein